MFGINVTDPLGFFLMRTDNDDAALFPFFLLLLLLLLLLFIIMTHITTVKLQHFMTEKSILQNHSRQLSHQQQLHGCLVV